MILFYKGYTVKDESNQNIMILCQVLNNIDFPLKAYKIKFRFGCRSSSISLTSVNSLVQRDVASLL
jgi:hypothetical protein